MAKGVSNMSRTMKVLKDKGYRYQKVEVYNIFDKKRHDMYGILDIVYLKHKDISFNDASGVIGCQITGNDYNLHKHKFEDNRDAIEDWLNAGGVLILWGWRKLKKVRGGKAMYWKSRIERVTIENNELIYTEINEDDL